MLWHNSSPSQEVPMRQSKFTETQIVSILKEADAAHPVNEMWRKYSISSATYL
jgi:putative transposase